MKCPYCQNTIGFSTYQVANGYGATETQCSMCNARGSTESFKQKSQTAQALEEEDRKLVQRIALEEVDDELNRAMKNWPPYNSAHEGLAILEEEVSELRRWVYLNQRKRDIQEMRKEAIQVAAVALRFALDICNEERGRK